MWKNCRKNSMWNKADGIYKRSSSGGGGWKNRGKLKQEWHISYELEIGKKLTFVIKPTGFKHTGLFPGTSFKLGMVYKADSQKDRNR